MKAIVEAKMREDDETTVEQLHSLLAFRGFHISKKTVFHCRADLGWTFRGSTYCQLRAPNKLKRLQWVKVYIQDSFEDVIWTDECSVQLEAHKRFCCRKQGDQSQGENEGDMQQALALVLKDGVASSSSNTCYILGQENFGKSYIAASLLGNMFEEGKKATHDADVDVCKVFASKWSRMKKTNVSKKLKELYHSENEEDMQQALSLALKDGVASSSSITIYILGQEKAGKTCLVASLLGNKFEEGKKATHGADVDVCKVFASKWSRMEKTNVSKKLKELYHRKLKSVAQIKMSTEQLQPALHAKDKQEFLDSLPKLPEPVRADLEQAKTAFLIDEDGINVIIWDFAGQSVYHGLHSMFLKEDSVVMIVFDASQSLKDPVKGRDSHTDPYTQKCISPITTGCESVRYWLQSIHSIRKDGTMLGATSSFVPTIFLVATHVDLIGDADAVDKRKAEIIEQLILIFEDQSFANHLPGAESDLRKAIMKNCFFISNKVRNEKELLLLKDALVQATQYILNKEHPVVYLNIERNVLAINKAAITRDELHDIAQDSGFFAEPESAEFKGAVEHFHRKGTILHFPQTKTLEDVVVLSPDWLTKLFSYVIIAHPYVVGTKHSLQFKRLKKYGILEETCISFMVNKFNEEQERFGLSLSTEQAIEFAQMFGFIAEVNSNTRFLDDLDQLPPSKERVFIVPAMLPFDLPSNIELPDDKNPQARIIYFKFPEKFVPRMIFYQVLGACIDRNIKRDEPLYCIRRQMIKMVLGCEQIYYVSLCESHHSIRLAIVPDEDTLSSQSFRERWELIEELNIKLMEKVKTFMRASDPPQRYIPCYLCSKLHLTLDKIRANDKPLHCLEGGKLRKDYYLDLRRYEGVHQFNEAKVTAPTYPKLLKYFEKIVDWKAVAAHLLQDDDGSKSAIIKKDNHEVADCCAAMIKQYLQSGNVSWEFVLSSLEKANHTNLVKDIKLAENL